jgi:hypothetical protein
MFNILVKNVTVRDYVKELSVDGVPRRHSEALRVQSRY